MSLLCRSVRGRQACIAGLAMVALALVACGQVTSSTADPVAVRIDPVTLEVGAAPYQISLSNKFSGSELTYTATSNKTSVATAKVDGATLTVTAVGAGEATITVTATDPQDRSARTSFTVIVSRPTSEPEPVAPTVRPGARASVDVAQGDTQTITLSTVFDGANLTYDVSSSAPAVATASESGGTLTIRGVSVESATITVTATNAGGSVEHAIAVTVTEPAPTPTPTPTTPTSTECPPPAGTYLVVVRDGNVKCTLQAGQRLDYRDASASLSIGEPSLGAPNVWTITANKKGRHLVYIEDSTSSTVGEITVRVPNSPPKRTVTQHPETEAARTLTVGTADDVGFHTTPDLDLGTYFNDVDEADNHDDMSNGVGDFEYRVSYQPPGVLINTERGRAVIEGKAAYADGDTDADLTGMLKLVILKKPEKDPFTIELYAHDRSNDPSNEPVTLKFTSVEPAPGTYAVGQDHTTGDFTIGGVKKSLKIGNRLDVPHTIEFSAALDGTTAVTDVGFWFAAKKVREYATDDNAGKSFLDTASGAGGRLCPDNRKPPKVGDSTIASGCYTYSAPSRVVISALDGSDVTPSITFLLPSKHNGLSGGTATVTIRYYVVTAKDKTDDFTTPTLAWRDAGSEALTLNIHKCVVTTDCPINSGS